MSSQTGAPSHPGASSHPGFAHQSVNRPGPDVHFSAGHSPQPGLTRVNGIGMWNSWTRNFKTPFLALLDLLDNSFDAALKPLPSPPREGGTGDNSATREADNVDGEPMSDDDEEGNGSKCPSSSPHFAACNTALEGFKGAIHIEPDKFCPPRQRQSQLPDHPVERTTGICIINNSFRPIKSLEKILEVYSSAKGRDKHGEGKFAETIGENGVGLKQGCATLSDLSFVLTRNGGRLSLGIIAASLQREEGIYLPSFRFQSQEETQLRREMERLFEAQHMSTVGECVKEYGGGSLSAGIGRLIGHFGKMQARGTWGEDNYVFCVVLHKLKHGPRVKNAVPVTTVQDDAAILANAAGPSSGTRRAVDAVMDPQAAEASEGSYHLMRELKDELPQNYIHVPHDFVVLVEGTSIDFCFWQRRLVEMNAFYANIDESTPYTEQPDDWKSPENSYPIRIFAGFDPTRAKGDKTPNLLIYSRQSGRLIMKDNDCRAVLNLNAGGTMFCQGLTIIVDDQWGNLPLNPTKQDIAFGEQANGAVHKRNLYAWVGAYVNFYYMYHYKKYNENKTLLTEKIIEHAKNIPTDASSVLPIDQSDFTSLEDMKWYVTRAGSIRTKNYAACKELQGQDTLWRLEASADTLPLSSKRAKPKKRKRDIHPSEDDRAQPKKRKTDSHDIEDDDVIFSQEDGDVNLPAPDAGLQLAVAQGFRSQGQSPSRPNQFHSVAEARIKGFGSQGQSPSRPNQFHSVAEARIRDLIQDRDRLQKAFEELKKKKKRYKEMAMEYLNGMDALEKKVEDLERNLRQKGHSPDGVRELELDGNINVLTEALAAEKETVEDQKKQIAELTEKHHKMSRKLAVYEEERAAKPDRDYEIKKLKSDLEWERDQRKFVESERDLAKEQKERVEKRVRELSP